MRHDSSRRTIMRAASGLLLVLFATLGPASEPEGISVSAFLDEIAAAPPGRIRQPPYGARDALSVIEAATVPGTRVEQVLARLQKDLALPLNAAQPLLAAAAEDGALYLRRQGKNHEKPDGRRLQAVEALYLAAAREAPQSLDILRSLAGFYLSWTYDRPTIGYGAILARLVAASRDPGRSAFELLRLWQDEEVWEALAPLVVRHLGGHPAALKLLGSRSLSAYGRAPLAELASKRLGKEPRDASIELDLAEDRLESLIESRLTGEVVAVLQTLPEAVRSRLLASQAGEFQTELEGLPYRGRLRDLRLGLAESCVLEGNRECAERFLSAVERDPRPRYPNDRKPELAIRFLRTLLSPDDGTDPFELLAAPGVGPQTIARLAARSGYRATAAEELARARELAEMELRWKPAFVIPPTAEAEVTRLRTEGQRLVAHLQAEMAVIAPTAPTDPMASTVARLLGEPPPLELQERPLPAGLLPSDIAPQDVSGRLSQQRREFRLPAGFDLARVERWGDEVAAIGTLSGSQNLGYWFIRSRDGGSTWSKPLYTGIARWGRYSIRNFSNLPLIGADRLQIEVERRDPGQPEFWFRKRSPTQGLVLDLPFALLERDSDGDGLTDLLEDALLTDKDNSDTDADGIGDAEDALPTVAEASGPFSEEAAFVAAVVERFLAVARHEIFITGQLPSTRQRERFPRTDARTTLFLVCDRALLASLRTNDRIVALAGPEFEKARARSGWTADYLLSTPLVSRDEGRASIRWSGGSQVGRFRGEKMPDGSWKLTLVDHLIS